MITEIKVPAFPESVTDGTLTTWHKQQGDHIASGEIIADIETDKVVFELPSLSDGVVEELLVEDGATVMAEQVVARIAESDADTPRPAESQRKDDAAINNEKTENILSPSAEKLVNEHEIDPASINGTGKDGRILKEDVLHVINRPAQQQVHSHPAEPVILPTNTTGRTEKRVPMTRLRAKIAERLVEAQQTAAILTTFNEVNMQAVMDLRKQHIDKFEKKHGVRLGFMSFFVKAVCEALKEFPAVNASIEGDDIVYHGFYDIGIAVSSPRGLVVPILRDANQMSMAAIETSIAQLGQRAKEGSLSLEEITGGTFSITNGGVFGSMLSTPILNPPQSGILGMHNIQKRPVVENDEIVIRPMMYLAFSYDHRIIDGREAVQFLVHIKNSIEDPARILLEI